MTPAARITAVLLLGVIAVSLGYLFQGYQGGADDYLFGGAALSPGEADRVESAIAAAGLTGYERSGGAIRVPKGQKDKYLAAVADGGALPATFDSVMAESLNLGPFASNDERRQRLKAAREQQLSMIVGMMNGVEDAKVMYDIREAHGLGGKENITATVSVMPAPGETLDPHRMKMIRGAVAGAVAGLKPTDVTILNLGDGSNYDEGGGHGADEFNEPYFQTRVSYEQMLRRNIGDFLRDIPGVRVQVSAELDDKLSATERTTEGKGEPLLLRSTKTIDETKDAKLDDGGRPGLSAQGPNRPTAEQAVAKSESTTNRSQEETENLVPVMEQELQRAGLVPTKVRAAIAIPTDYVVRVWREQSPDAKPDAKPTKDEITRLQADVKDSISNTLAPLFPRELAENQQPFVQVTYFQSLTPDPVTAPSTMSKGLLWASQNSGALIMAGLALVSLTMLRSMVKSIPPAETNVVLAPRLATGTSPTSAGAASGAAGTSSASAGADGAAGSAASGEKQRPRLKLKKSGSLKDDLTDLVRDDPDSAAAILKSWIGNAG